MLDHFKALFAVAGGVAGVSGGAVTLTLRQSSLGGGSPILASASIAEITPLSPVSEDTVAQVSDTGEESLTQSTEHTQAPQRVEEVTHLKPVKKEEKDNCEILNFPNLDDIFYNLITDKVYTLISCSKTNKDSYTELSDKWTGLFPSQLFSSRETGKKFKLTAEVTGSIDNGSITFHGDIFSPSTITGKRNGMWQAKVSNKELLVQEIDLTEPQSSGKIFLAMVENVEFLR